jgi:hypothetical protein
MGFATAQAQNARRLVNGRVLNGNDEPVAQVTIVAGSLTATSDDSGRFRLEISHRSRIVLDLRRLGFMPSRLAIDAGGDTTVAVLLLASPQRLPGVGVTETPAKSPTLTGFEQRMAARKRAAGTGHFLTLADIEARNAQRTTQLVENTPSMRVTRKGNDGYAIYGRDNNGSDCLATIWLDGVRIAGEARPMIDRRTRRVVPGPALTELDSYVNPSDLAGVEIYPRGLMAPSQLVPLGDDNAARCAIVAFWTKHARR